MSTANCGPRKPHAPWCEHWANDNWLQQPSKICNNNHYLEAFWRCRVNSAFRTVWACFMAALVLNLGGSVAHGASSSSKSWVTFPIFAYVIAVTVVGESTAGRALHDAVAVLTGTTQAVGMAIAVLHVLPHSYNLNLSVALIFIFLSCFIILHPTSPHILHKRVALAHTGIIYISAVVQQNSDSRFLFPLKLAATTIVGATCGALALLLPLPHLAIRQVHGHAKLSTRIAAQRVRVLVDSFCMGEGIRASALAVQASCLAKMASSTNSEINSKRDGMQWENRFPWNESGHMDHLIGGLIDICKNLAAMELALMDNSCLLQSSRRASTDDRKILQKAMQGCLQYVSGWCSLALMHATMDSRPTKFSTQRQRQIIVEEGDEALRSFDDAITAMQYHLAYVVPSDAPTPAPALLGNVVLNDGAAQVADHNTLDASPAVTFGAQVTALFFLFNLRQVLQKTKRLLCHPESDADSPISGPPSISKPDTDLCLQECGGNHESRCHLLGQFSSSGCTKQNRNVMVYLPSPYTNACGRLQHAPSTYYIYLAPRLPILNQRLPCNNVPALCLPASEAYCQRCSVMNSDRLAPEDQIGSESNFWTKRWRKGFSHYITRPSHLQLMTALKMSLAMSVGAFLGYWFNNKKGYWADITLALGFTGPAKGGSFKVAVLRTLGTASGSVYGLMVVLATLQYPVLRLMALIPWVVLTSFLRESRIFGYSGALSALTGAVVILARTNKDSTDEEFTVIRIVEAFFGMASFIIVEMLLFPRRAASLVKTDVIRGLGEFEETVNFMLRTYAGKQFCHACWKTNTDELATKEKKLKRVISRQNSLIKEAVEEPQFWFAPFPASIYRNITRAEEQMVDCLHFSLSALQEIKRVTDNSDLSVYRLLRTAPLKPALNVVEEEVLHTLTFLAKVMSTGDWGHSDRLCNFTNYEGVACKVSDAAAAIQHRRRRHQQVDIESHKSSDLETGRAPGRAASRTAAWELDIDDLLLPQYGHTGSRRSQIPPCSFMMEHFQSGILQVASELASIPSLDMDIGNTIVLSLGTLAFGLHGLLHYTTNLKQAVHELLQNENPWHVIDFCHISKHL